MRARREQKKLRTLARAMAVLNFVPHPVLREKASTLVRLVNDCAEEHVEGPGLDAEEAASLYVWESTTKIFSTFE